MRILHTADWHLNNRLGRIELQPNIRARLEEIAAILRGEKIDVMVVAGDLFSHFTRMDELRTAVQDVNRIFKPFLMDGGTIVAISGNHDNEALFQMLRLAMDLASPINPKDSGPRPPGRLYLAADPTYLLLADRDGNPVQFVLLPYPTAARYLRDEQTRYGSLDEKNQRLHGALLSRLEQIQATRIRPKLPSVLVSHVHVRGSTIHTTYQISEREDVIFEQGEIPVHWAYGAYGHIHKSQALDGTGHIRYAGSIERFDYAEREDEKGVVVVEVGRQGRVGSPQVIPLDATPIHRIELEIEDPERDLSILKDQYSAEATRALVSYRVVYRPGEHDRDAIRREIERLFPFWYAGEAVPAGSALSGSPIDLPSQPRDVLGTVQEYLRSQVPAEDRDREALLVLAEQLWLERGVEV
ncbi:MAG: exonuclease SbcCD subunit D [Armatimonadota bacterium]